MSSCRAIPHVVAVEFDSTARSAVLEYERGSVEDLKHLRFPAALKGVGFRPENAERTGAGHVLLVSVVEGDVLELCSGEYEEMLSGMFASEGCVPEVALMPYFSHSVIYSGKVCFPPTKTGCAVSPRFSLGAHLHSSPPRPSFSFPLPYSESRSLSDRHPSLFLIGCFADPAEVFGPVCLPRYHTAAELPTVRHTPHIR
jgi:hypothetical protein